MADYDSPWKDMLEQYFPEFMAFFFPEAHTDIDWARGYESLDKELQQIVRDAELGARLVDKLIKVWRRSGEAQIVLVHIEVQGDYDRDFAKRMYVYNYRLFDRYDKPVVSLAVLGDERRRWRPRRYGYELWGCRVGIEFPVVKLADYTRRQDELEASANPFAVIVSAHLTMRATKRDPEARLRGKLGLVRRLYERGYGRKDILELFRFIDWILLLPAELEQRFDEALEEVEATMGTPYITSIERRGIEKGALIGKAELLRNLLIQRFGSLPKREERRLENAEQEQLDLWATRILQASSLDEVFSD